jgi:ribonuclease P protein component
VIELNTREFRFYETNLSTEQHSQKTYPRFPHPHGNAGRTQGAQAPPRKGTQTLDGFGAAETRAELVRAGGISLKGTERFPKSARLRKRAEFLKLSRFGQKLHSANFVIISRANDAPESRLGITVSGKVGNSVTRNRIKRQVREFFRRRRGLLPGRDVLVIARKSAADLGAGGVVSELERVLERRPSERGS